MADKHSWYHEHQGKYVSVNAQGISYLGLLESDSLDTLVLRPCLVNDSKISFKDGEIKFTPRYRLERERPAIIDTAKVIGVEPSTEERANYLVQVTNAPINSPNSP